MDGKRALVVEDDSNLRQTLVEVLAAEGFESVTSIGSLGEFHGLTSSRFDLVLLDYRLPDCVGIDILRELTRSPCFPAVVAISGDIGPAEAFALAQSGTHTFLRKPFGLNDIREAIRSALTGSLDISLEIRRSLGVRSLHSVEEDVRVTMVNEALARSHGNVSVAARLLGISRQLLNHIRKKDA